jgi:malate dehydrogenase
LKEYGQNDICIGVPCILVKWYEEILDIELMMKKALFAKSADAVRQMNDALKSILAKKNIHITKKTTLQSFF